MKVIVVLAALVAVCLSSAIPKVPGDNSDYVEGESRYIWMPDGEGIPHLVDLEEPVPADELASRNGAGANNAYWLYTRENPTTSQILVVNDASSVYGSNFRFGAPIKVIVHGWNSNGNSDINPLITEAFLANGDVNVIVVDWRRAANSLYNLAVARVPSVGIHLGHFLLWLTNLTNVSLNDVHLVGFSLGAHIVGNAGRTANGQFARITGLDPAGPRWGGNSLALKADDAIYVEAIHTDGGALGIFDPIGAVNFYPNGGRNRQPGCWLNTCSHSRAYELFASSLYSNHFVANECETLRDARRMRCTGQEFNMGNGDLTKVGSGLFAVETSNRWPY